MPQPPKYLILHYLHRDAGNYKNYGEVTFLNDIGLTIEQFEVYLGPYLQDYAYFYPTQWHVPSLDNDEGHVYGAEAWHEYLRIEGADELEVEEIFLLGIFLLEIGSQANAPGQRRET